ncbi:MAG: GTPase Era [Gammaproteobacteria bacterium]
MRCGFVAIVGRPNVGKSTLLNRIVGQKVSITSHRPQTTRHRIVGIKTAGETQYVYVDTPGLHLGAKSAINRYMNRTASSALADVDVVLFVVEALRWTDEDENVASRLTSGRAPVILVVNKVDVLKDKSALLPYLEQVAGKGKFAEIVPVSAGTGTGLVDLERLVARRLPEGVHYFPEDQVTDRSERFLAAELVREKLMRMLRQELPYALTVEIERFREDEGVLHVDAVIWVERKGQKAIVIGKGGATLKEVGKQARLEMEAMFASKVFLRLWVKVKEGWADDERILRSLGYSDEH